MPALASSLPGLLLLGCSSGTAGVLSRLQPALSAVAAAASAATAAAPPAAAAAAAAPWRGFSSSPVSSFASSREVETLERRMDELQGRVLRLEAVEAARSALCRLLTWLDAARQDATLVTAAAAADMFTPSAVLNTGKYGSAESLEEIVPLLLKLAKQGSARRQYTTNIVADPSRDDLSIVRATAYTLVVEPVAGAKPAVTSMYNVSARLEKGLDEKWRIKSVAFVETVGST